MMSSEKKGSWRKGKFQWVGRLYISESVINTLKKMAQAEDRDVNYVMSKILEKNIEEQGKV